jgi:hypothetical protein
VAFRFAADGGRREGSRPRGSPWKRGCPLSRRGHRPRPAGSDALIPYTTWRSLGGTPSWTSPTVSRGASSTPVTQPTRSRGRRRSPYAATSRSYARCSPRSTHSACRQDRRPSTDCVPFADAPHGTHSWLAIRHSAWVCVGVGATLGGRWQGGTSGGEGHDRIGRGPRRPVRRGGQGQAARARRGGQQQGGQSHRTGGATAARHGLAATPQAHRPRSESCQRTRDPARLRHRLRRQDHRARRAEAAGLGGRSGEVGEDQGTPQRAVHRPIPMGGLPFRRAGRPDRNPGRRPGNRRTPGASAPSRTSSCRRPSSTAASTNWSGASRDLRPAARRGHRTIARPCGERAADGRFDGVMAPPRTTAM